MQGTIVRLAAGRPRKKGEGELGRLRDRCATEEEFCRALEEEFHRVAGLAPREAEIERRMEGYRHQLEELDRAAVKHGLTNPHTIDGIRKSLEAKVLRGPEIHPRASPAVVETVLAENDSAAIPGFDFVLSPEWDADDIAVYCLSPHRLDSFRTLLVNWWLVPWAKLVWDGEQRREAVRALKRCFYPLVEKLIRDYYPQGKTFIGSKYGRVARAHLRDALEGLIEMYDFFYKKDDRVGTTRRPRPDLGERRAATIYSAAEYPISAFLERKLETEIRALVGLDRRTQAPFGGPFRVDGHDGLVGLLKDVERVLNITGSAINEHRKKGHMTAWQARDFRRVIGIPPGEPIELRPEADVMDRGIADQVREGIQPESDPGDEIVELEITSPSDEEDDEERVSGYWVEAETIRITGDTYWIYDWESVLDMLPHRVDGQYRFEKPGPKRKERP
jgi:hypothetical protein